MEKLRSFFFKFTVVSAGILIVSSSSAFAAGTITEDTVVTEIEKFSKVAEGLATLVTLFTSILITPMGISAGAKVFKTLVLYNL